MNYGRYSVLMAILFTLLTYIGYGQTKEIKMLKSRVSTRIIINETTEIIDKVTGQRVSYAEFQQRMQNDPNGYHLEPIYNEFGKVDAYTLRTTTAEERTTHFFYDVDTTRRPRAGETMPPFVMTGFDGKTYRSTDLKGKPVILVFWLDLLGPYFNKKQMNTLAETMKPYQESANLVALGVVNDNANEINELIKTTPLPFVPVPDSHGFHWKFHIATTPSFLVIDSSGKVVAYVDEVNPDRLKAALDKAIR